jgi:hypothetical protein
MSEATDIEGRFAAYLRKRQLEPLGPLGSGMHGQVFRAHRPSAAGEVAIKIHSRLEPFEIELETYLRLREAEVIQVLGFNVPQLLAFDTDLRALELTVVQQPFVLDFAEVRLEFPHEFPPDVWSHWLEEKREQFGARWPVVQQVLDAFEGLGIYLMDVSPRNIAFREA